MKKDFYLRQLKSKEEKKIYMALKSAIETHESSINVISDFSGEQISRVLSYILLDYPDYFWTKGDFRLFSSKKYGMRCLEIQPIYLFDENECEYIQDGLKDALSEISCYVDNEKDTENRIRRMASWFLDNVEYSHVEKYDQTIYSALVFRKSVCMGIAKAIALLLRLYGIDSIIVKGTLFGESHVWNLININGTWKHLDVAAMNKCFDAIWSNHGLSERKELILVDKDALTGSHMLEEIKYP